MKLIHSSVCALVIATVTSCAYAESTSSGSTSINGKIVNFEFKGDKTSVKSSATNGICTIDGMVDGTTHEIEISSEQLVWNKETVEFDGYQKIEIRINRDRVNIEVDGKVVISKP